MRVFDVGLFDQDDENAYTLELWIETNNDDDLLILQMDQGVADDLWRALDKTIGAHWREGRQAAAEHERDLALNRAIENVEIEREKMADAADMARKAEKENA